MSTLRDHFEDPLWKLKAKISLQYIKQGNRSVSEYAMESKNLAGQLLDWPESLKMEYFQMGLQPEICREGNQLR